RAGGGCAEGRMPCKLSQLNDLCNAHELHDRLPRPRLSPNGGSSAPESRHGWRRSAPRRYIGGRVLEVAYWKPPGRAVPVQAPLRGPFTKRKTALKVLETQRLVLRRLSAADAPFVLELLNDPAWLEHIGDRGVRTLDDARAYLAAGPVAMYAEHGFGLYLVEVREDGAPAGICGLVRRDFLDDVDLGFAFLPRYRG